MTATVTDIYRHPVKSHGRERLDSVALTAGKTLPWDRAWAVVHDRAPSDVDGSEWVSCRNFARAAIIPELMAISARLDEDAGTVTLSHPDHPDFTFNPDTEVDAFCDWVAVVVPRPMRKADRIIRLEGRGLTDTAYPSVSINNRGSLRALSSELGQELSPHRFRGNIWIDGLPAWREHELAGATIRIGSAVLRGVERIERCPATTSNPTTGQRDADTLGALRRRWGHTDFGLHAEVIESGQVQVGDHFEVLT
ncbi:MAG: MOSC domain-containing protein [Pseudomonadota bacterium]